MESPSDTLPGYTPVPPQGASISHQPTSNTASTSHAGDDHGGLGDVQFDIVPRSDATSFQAGYLGMQDDGFEVWVKGDVLVKLPALNPSTSGRGSRDTSARMDSTGSTAPTFERCSISFTATEASRSQSIVLFSSIQTLWDASDVGALPSSSSQAARIPSSVLPFSFPLTADLPHCIHLPNSYLIYELTARLHAPTGREGQDDLVKRVQVHLTRYSRPGKLGTRQLRPDLACYSERPQVWHVHDPLPVGIRLAKTLLRRAEPIDIKVRIPPTFESDRSFAEKGLSLRSVEAELIRVIALREGTAGKGRSNGDTASAADLCSGSETVGAPPNETSSGAAQAATAASSSSHAILSSPDAPVQQQLLAHSGKLARFHSRRPVLLRLTLHPPFDSANMPYPHPDHDAAQSGPVYGRGGGGGCESISQETLLHDVSFRVRVRVGIRGALGEDRAVRVERVVWIEPGAIGGGKLRQPGGGDLAAGGLASAGEKGTDLQQGKQNLSSPGMSPRGQALSSAVASSSSALPSGDETFEDFDSLDEYDGYEDVGRPLAAEGDDNDEDAEAHALEEALWPSAASDAIAGPGDGRDGAGPSARGFPNDASIGHASMNSAVVHFDGSQAEPRSERTRAYEQTGPRHSRQLEQLRMLLDRSGPQRAETQPREPPPSLLDSRNDLQVEEVEVEGVGLAVPRTGNERLALASSRAGSDRTAHRQGHGAPSLDLPPFEDHDLHGYSAREAQLAETDFTNDDTWEEMDSTDTFPPPPPMSPPPPLHAADHPPSEHGYVPRGAIQSHYDEAEDGAGGPRHSSERSHSYHTFSGPSLTAGVPSGYAEMSDDPDVQALFGRQSHAADNAGPGRRSELGMDGGDAFSPAYAPSDSLGGAGTARISNVQPPPYASDEARGLTSASPVYGRIYTRAQTNPARASPPAASVPLGPLDGEEEESRLAGSSRQGGATMASAALVGGADGSTAPLLGHDQATRDVRPPPPTSPPTYALSVGGETDDDGGARSGGAAAGPRGPSRGAAASALPRAPPSTRPAGLDGEEDEPPPSFGGASEARGGARAGSAGALSATAGVESDDGATPTAARARSAVPRLAPVEVEGSATMMARRGGDGASMASGARAWRGDDEARSATSSLERAGVVGARPPRYEA